MENFKDEWYLFDGIDQIDTPALVIYPERVVANISRLKAMVPSVDMLRPHVKTNKSVAATKLMVDHGITKFKCATLPEAEMLGICKAPDVLLAYQPSKIKLEKFIGLIRFYSHTSYSCLVDNIESAEMISATAKRHGLVIPIFIDLNVGMNRTGIIPEAAFELYTKILLLQALEFKGFHAYDGHIRDADLEDRIRSCDSHFTNVESLRLRIEEVGNAYPLLVAGGSPTFGIHAKRRNVECSPGTFIFWDKGYHDTIIDQDFLFAALVINRIVSRPDDTKICIDLGYKSISSENDLQNRVFFLNAPNLKPYSHSEEHMVIEAGEGHTYKIGDIFFSLPIHICPTVAMYDSAFTIIGNKLESRWPITARGRDLKV